MPLEVTSVVVVLYLDRQRHVFPILWLDSGPGYTNERFLSPKFSIILLFSWIDTCCSFVTGSGAGLNRKKGQKGYTTNTTLSEGGCWNNRAGTENDQITKIKVYCLVCGNHLRLVAIL